MGKWILAAAVLMGLAGPALADTREDVVAGLTRCAALTDDRQWLDCYYGAAQPMRAWLGLSPAPQAQLKLVSSQPMTAQPRPMVLPIAPAAPAPVRTGPPPMPKPSSIYKIFGGSDIVKNAPVQNYEVVRRAFTITLADGQVWRQTEDDADRLPVHWTQDVSSMRVTISQGAMSTFNLVMNDEIMHHKVVRIR